MVGFGYFAWGCTFIWLLGVFVCITGCLFVCWFGFDCLLGFVFGVCGFCCLICYGLWILCCWFLVGCGLFVWLGFGGVVGFLPWFCVLLVGVSTFGFDFRFVVPMMWLVCMWFCWAFACGVGCWFGSCATFGLDRFD